MTPWTDEAADLATRIARFVRQSLSSETTEDFGELALAVHRWQHRNDPVLRALCPTVATGVDDIVGIPVALFKDLPVGTLGRDEVPGAVFRTSGTTGGGRGVHRMRGLALYDLGSLTWARARVPSMPKRVVALLDDPSVAPDSSLSHMVGLFGPASWHVRDGVLDILGLARALAEADGPRFVATTAFALAEWLEAGPSPLPAHSVLMVTGGFKGRVHRLEGDALYEAAHHHLRPGELVVEYGMTELSSQLWGVPGRPYLPPPWLRVRAVDPASGEVLPAGTPGQLKFVDLCNLDSTLAIETMDAGHVDAAGQVHLSGRLLGAPARGCSLTVEDAWAEAIMSWARVRRWRDVLRAVDPHRAAPHLSAAGAAAAWSASLDALDDATLARVEALQVEPFTSAVVVCARTVFTGPLEWCAVLLGRGTSVHLKHPQGLPGATAAMVAAAAQVGLPLTCGADRSAIEAAPLVVAMGSDATVHQIEASAPGARVLAFGHRFSVAWLTDPASVDDLAADLALHDGRGCLSPVAVLTPLPVATVWPALIAAMEHAEARWPRGEVSAAEHARIRARRGLATVLGAVHPAEHWELHQLPAASFEPIGLPRVLAVHHTDDPKATVADARRWLSTVGTDDPGLIWPAARICPLGQMQRPPVERHHDGVDWLQATGR